MVAKRRTVSNIKKQRKIHATRTFFDFRTEFGYFGNQFSKRSINPPKKKKNIDLYGMVSGYGKARNHYNGVQWVYPGQKVWVIRINNYTGVLSVDYDYVADVFSFGQIGSGGLVNYWLYDYEIGHALEYMLDFFPTKKIAEYYMKKVMILNHYS